MAEGTPSAPEAVPVEPWRSFLKELDELLTAPIELRCLGGLADEASVADS